MAELILRNVDPSLVRTLEEQAKRLGSTIEAEAVRLLESVCMPGARVGGASDVDSGAPEQDEGASSPGSSLPEPSSGPPDARAPSLEERQAALAAAYPDEYVVLVKERVVAHTRDKDEAYAHHEAALDEGDGEPIIIPPGTLRRIGPPVIRGRALAGTSGAARR